MEIHAIKPTFSQRSLNIVQSIVPKLISFKLREARRNSGRRARQGGHHCKNKIESFVFGGETCFAYHYAKRELFLFVET